MTTTTPMTAPPGTGPPDPAVNDQAAMRAEARDQVRHAAAQWLTGDRTAALGQQMVLSITRYRQANQRSPTWAEALAGVDPALWEPITTVPEGWPLAPAVWRRELRQRLMSELKHARWVTYTRTPRSLHPGDVGRGWLSTTNPPPDGPHPPDTAQ